MWLFLVSVAVGPLLVEGAVSNICKREDNFIAGSWGFDNCDENGLACCYYIKINETTADGVIVYSHGWKDGAYVPNTHCQYIIEIDPKCEIAACFEMGFGLDGDDMIKVHNRDVQMDLKQSKRKMAPGDFIVPGNKIQVDFISGDGEKPNGSKWAMGFVCNPENDYKTICELCDDIKDQLEEGPDGDNIVKLVD